MFLPKEAEARMIRFLFPLEAGSVEWAIFFLILQTVLLLKKYKVGNE
jgi:hypothetical protein